MVQRRRRRRAEFERGEAWKVWASERRLKGRRVTGRRGVSMAGDMAGGEKAV